MVVKCRDALDFDGAPAPAGCAARISPAAPGDVATFMLGYGGNPSGAEPYAVACPVASAVRVILPGTHEFGTAITSIAPCEGLVQVSPIVPGADRLTF